MPSTLLRPLSKIVRRVKKIRRIRRKHRKPLAERLSAAKRINPPHSPHHHHHHHHQKDKGNKNHSKHDRLHHHHHQNSNLSIADGAWKCCNGHTQDLIHWRGRHPFKHLTCTHCTHILCQHCSTTSILTPFSISQHQMIEIAKSSAFIAFGQVCRGCGLSHRGRVVKTNIDTAAHERVATLSFDGVVCECGRVAGGEWFRFKIGGPEEFRRDPEGAVEALAVVVVVEEMGKDGLDGSSVSSVGS